MASSIWFNRINLGLSIVNVEGSQESTYTQAAYPDIKRANLLYFQASPRRPWTVKQAKIIKLHLESPLYCYR